MTKPNFGRHTGPRRILYSPRHDDTYAQRQVDSHFGRHEPREVELVYLVRSASLKAHVALMLPETFKRKREMLLDSAQGDRRLGAVSAAGLGFWTRYRQRSQTKNQVASVLDGSDDTADGDSHTRGTLEDANTIPNCRLLVWVINLSSQIHIRLGTSGGSRRWSEMVGPDGRPMHTIRRQRLAERRKGPVS